MSSKGWVVIPRDLRKKYGLKRGTRVAIVDYAGSLSIVPVPEDPIAVALAQELGARVVTGDPEFRTVVDLVSAEWLPGA